jgi:hypothetical protein
LRYFLYWLLQFLKYSSMWSQLMLSFVLCDQNGWFPSNKSTYYYHLLNVISLGLAQCDHINWCLLYLPIFYLLLQWTPLNGITDPINQMILKSEWIATYFRYDRVIWDMKLWIKLIPLADWYHYPWSHGAASTEYQLFGSFILIKICICCFLKVDQ